jgi:hypothetical protein
MLHDDARMAANGALDSTCPPFDLLDEVLEIQVLQSPVA